MYVREVTSSEGGIDFIVSNALVQCFWNKKNIFVKPYLLVCLLICSVALEMNDSLLASLTLSVLVLSEGHGQGCQKPRFYPFSRFFF